MKKENAITLIALIITVIVMLILAGVTISLTIGNNGIFKKSQEGAEIYKNSDNNEATSLNSVDKEMGDLINQYQGGKIEEVKPGKPDEKGIYTENSTINGEKAEAFNPEIPKGFRPVNVDTAEWGNGSSTPSKEAVKAGLVIEDEEGNQFVWIAVDGETVKLNRYTFASNGAESVITDTSYMEEDATNTNNLKNYGNTIAKDINQFKESVAEHGGYYMARYEASYGTDGKPNSKISTGTPIKSDGVEYAPTEEGQLWNNALQTQAATACQNMYDDNYGITSDLMNSYAWDTAILFIQKYSGDSDYAMQKGTSVSNSLTNTGTNGDERCHIHDMSSNNCEWVTETYNSAEKPCVLRGGYYYSDIYYTSYRTKVSTTLANCSLTFRPILYL